MGTPVPSTDVGFDLHRGDKEFANTSCAHTMEDADIYRW